MAEHQLAETATPAVPRAILEDRYNGLLMNKRRGMIGDYNKLQVQLDAIIRRLAEGTARTEGMDGKFMWDGVEWNDDGYGVIISKVQKGIRTTIIDMVEQFGLAR